MQIRSLKLALVLLLAICVGRRSAPVVTIGVIRHRFRLVTDPSNAVVAGAAIMLTDSSTNISRNPNTNTDGAVLLRGRYPGHL